MNAEQLVEQAKKKAAYMAVEQHVTAQTKKIGIGSGTTVVYVVERLVSFAKEQNMAPLICVPTSFQAKQLILEHHPHTLHLSSLDVDNDLDVAFDGADEVDAEYNLIKGGGAALFQEKLVASCAKELVIVADYRKKSEKLCTQYKKGIPIEVLPIALNPVHNKLKQVLASKYHAKTRLGVAKIGPVVTDNGNLIIDITCDEPIPVEQVAAFNATLTGLVGVVETGLFIKYTKRVYFGMQDGTVVVM